MKAFFGRKSRSALATVLIVSLALHLVAIAIFGMIKIVTDVFREETVFEALPIAHTPQKEPEYTVNLVQMNRSTPPPRPPTITVNNPSELDIPTLDIDVNINTSSVFGRSAGGFGTGLDGIRQMAISANLFGMNITSSNLGVVLDVSGSAHAYLDKAVSEIDDNFPSAHIVLVVGCGMSDGSAAFNGGGGKVPGPPRILDYSRRDNEKKHNWLKRSVPAQLNMYFGKLQSERRQYVEKYLENRQNLYVLYGGDIHAANFAFDHLLKQNVDTIYWFADFADNIDPGTIKKLTEDLRRARVKVIAHNFTGKPVRKDVAQMTESTGGQSIAVVPGK